jgi:hypothetical protein
MKLIFCFIDLGDATRDSGLDEIKPLNLPTRLSRSVSTVSGTLSLAFARATWEA